MGGIRAYGGSPANGRLTSFSTFPLVPGPAVAGLVIPGLGRGARLLGSDLFLEKRADLFQGRSCGNSVFLSQDVD